MNDFFYEIFKLYEQMNGMSFIQTLKFKGFENIKEYLYFLQGGKCCYCNKQIRLKQMTREHLIPKSYGGSNLIFNICLVCKNCNEERGCILCNQKSIKELYRRFYNPMWWY
jgi:5-methylcytosine-specific restriction endonuclease McrA